MNHLEGEPVAEIRPLDPVGGTHGRMEWLRSRGTLGEPGGVALAAPSYPRALASPSNSWRAGA
jgi:hypothetical protein